MQVGDFVRYKISDNFDAEYELSFGIGVVVAIEFWKDSGAPDRNFGVRVTILWSDGQIGELEEDELEIVNEDR